MKKLIPSPLRLYLKICFRYFSDLKTGQLSDLISRQQRITEDKSLFQPQISVSQLMRMSPESINKKHNLSLAMKVIENVLIQQGKIFSFWHLIENPSQKQGYLEGRSIVANQIKKEYGGGLCQLSELIHFIALKAGLNILERYPHSQDLYTEETRFAPLGSDATVVYGYKDLRFKNNLSVPILFRFKIDDHQATAILCTTKPITEWKVEFKQEPLENGIKVDTIRYLPSSNQFELLYSEFYPKYN